MALNVTTAVFRPGFNIATASPSLVQWDQGQVLKFEGVELPSAYQVEFTNAVTVQAITMIGNENGVEIPNELLQQSFPITAYIVLHETAEDRETEYWATIYVKARQKPREETPDPEQTSVIDQTIAALQDGVAEAQAAANEAAAASQAVQNMGVEAETLPAGSAATVEKTVDPETGVVTLTYGIPKGGKGDKGDKGNTGETYMLAPSVDTIVKNPNTGTFIPAQIIFTVYKVVNGTSSPYRAAAIVADIFGMGMVPHYEVVNDYRLTVPINSIADTGYVACSAYGNGGIIATITIPCILDGAKGDPGEGVAPNGTTGQFLKKKSEADYDTEWADVDPGVTSVNGKTGAVTLTASDVGAKPASYEAPVSSVNEKTGAVVLDAGDIGYDGETTYPDASVGKELGTINSALSSLSAVTEIIDTASGAIASFPDGSGLPMRSLVAEINPVQDLHGYDAPWPAGAKNKLPPVVKNGSVSMLGVTFYSSNGELYLTGTATGSGGRLTFLTDLFQLQAGTYTVSCPTNYQLVVYNTNNEIIANTIGGTSATFTLDSAQSVQIGVNVTNGVTYSGVAKFMLEVGSTASVYQPYSNICPISGWTGLTGQRTGVNQWDEEWENGRFNLTTGAKSSGNGVASKNKISVLPNTSYYATCGNYGANAIVLLYYDVNENFLSYEIKYSLATTFTTPNNAHYVNFNLQSSSAVTTYNHDISINYPSTDTSYHAYTGEPISVSWQTEAGTVYGGTATYNGDGTWTLVAEYALASAKKNQFNAKSTGSVMDYRNAGPFPPTASITDWDKARQQQISNMARIANANSEGQYGNYVAVVYTLASGLERSDVRVSEDLYQAMTDDDTIEVCYKLLEPQTYTITTEQLLNTLYGQNNVWVDTGNVSVTYQASIKGYIDKVLGS